MNISYSSDGSIESVTVSHPKLARLTAQELLLCYGFVSTQTIGENTDLAERAYKAGTSSQTYVDNAADGMVAAGFITTQRASEIKA
jgi:hypothetical protein